MTYSFRPAKRENTPLIIGLAGPTKSGKTYSSLRLAAGLASGAPVIMLNAEGARGHQYADTFKYLACDLVPPYRYPMYEEAMRAAADQKPGAIIIDSMSHAHDGPGGFLEWHEEELTRMAGSDYVKREKVNFAGWIKPKAAENAFRYALLEMPCPVILCMRAKEKIKIVPGRPPIDLGWQPIVGESLAFETIFTVMLPPHSQGVPDLSTSELREPFDTLIPKGKAIDESLGLALSTWAKGGTTASVSGGPARQAGSDALPIGATSGGGTGGIPPSDDEMIASDYAARFDEVTSGAEGKEWSKRWDKARASLTPEHQALGDAARDRARTRLRKGGGR